MSQWYELSCPPAAEVGSANARCVYAHARFCALARPTHAQPSSLPLTLPLQAHRFVITAFLTGSRILGRSFVAAYKQAQAASNYQRAQAKVNGGSGASARASLSSGMTLDEACRILNVKPPAGGQANVEEVLARYKRLFDANEPQNGGSFYLQSKIVRAKERFERELGPIRERAEQEAETKEGWKPKVYKDR